MQSLHITRADVDAMYWDDIDALFDYWRQYPPMHVLMAGYVGYKPPPPPMPYEQSAAIDQLASALAKKGS